MPAPRVSVYQPFSPCFANLWNGWVPEPQQGWSNGSLLRNQSSLSDRYSNRVTGLSSSYFLSEQAAEGRYGVERDSETPRLIWLLWAQQFLACVVAKRMQKDKKPQRKDTTVVSHSLRYCLIDSETVNALVPCVWGKKVTWQRRFWNLSLTWFGEKL